MSLQSLARQQKAEDAIDADQLFRVLDGYDLVPAALHGQLRNAAQSVRLNTVVRSVRWRGGHVELGAESSAGYRRGPFTARRLMVTVPAGVLQAADSICFEPGLGRHGEAIRELAMGHVKRVTLRFREPFWELRDQLADMSFLHATGEPWPTWWTQSPIRVPMITAWAGGPAADEIRTPDLRELVRGVIASLAHTLSVPQAKVEGLVEDWYYHDWQADPFSLGAYTYVAVNGLDAVRQMTEPVEDTLYFAGEATDIEGHWGTVHGAIRTGQRAADQILDSLRA